MLRAEVVQSEGAVDSNERAHRSLASANARRFAPRRSAGDFDAELERDATLRRSERAFVEAERAAIKSEARAVPTDPEPFAAWFESLTETHCTETDALLSWLANEATGEQVQWYRAHERAHDTDFEDLLALTRVNMPASAKLEFTRNQWQEISHGSQPQLFPRRPTPPTEAAAQPLWEALAVDNLMVALATARHYAYQSLGALGRVEDPVMQGAHVAEQALVRPAFGGRHFVSWSRDVLAPLVSNDPSLAPLIAEGALMRLRLVAQRDARYLQMLKHSSSLVAEFEYAEDGPAAAPLAAPAVRPVRWRDVSARAHH